jgi:hypothetical protein
MARIKTLILGSIIFTGTFTGCSLGPQVPPPEEIQLESLSLYYGRSRMGGAAFEQFKITGNTMYAECGNISGGRHAAQDQKLLTLSQVEIDDLKGKAWSVQRYVAELDAKFDPPGGTSGMFDSGRLTLNLQFANGPIKVDTSFDSIVNGTEGRSAVVASLAAAVRKAAGDKLCGSSSFFGLTRPRP